jgi:oxygen-independent coproporphyrinogen-3 oxidase
LEKLLTIVLNDSSLKYEVEATVKIFYPASKFNILYYGDTLESLDTVEGDYISATVDKTYSNEGSLKGTVLLSLNVRLGDQTDTIEKRLRNHNIEDTKEYHDFYEYNLCKLIYDTLSQHTGIKSAWGLITGIRPVKKYAKLIEDGLSESEIVSQMYDRYYISEKKSKLAYDTAINQAPILKSLTPNKVSIYVSIPFCNTRCSYCSFVSHSIESAKKLIPDYVYYLCREIESVGELVKRHNLVVDTIYFGGGTPTSLEDYQLRTIMQKIQECLDLTQVREYCVEAGRPDTITRSKLEVIKQFGADRISVNPQTFNDHVLETIGRKHTSQQTVDAFKLAREVGFENINMDLIVGLPTDTLDSFKHTLDVVNTLNPDSVTVHTLTLKRSATLFENQTGRDNVHNPVSSMVDYSVENLTQHGYRPYYMYRQKNTAENLENVGYAREGKESLYNVYIMDEIQTIIGVGAGASTKLVGGERDISRVHNYKFPYEYINRFDDLMSKRKAIEEFFTRL